MSNNMSLNYEQYGTGKTVLFLHGFNVNPNFHESYLSHMGNGYEILAPHLIDYRPKCGSLEDYVDLSLSFLNEHKIDNYSVIGYSLGGGIAIELCDSENQPNKYIGLAPLSPVDHGLLGFIPQGLKLLISELGLVNYSNYNKKFELFSKIYSNFTDDICSTISMMSDLANYSISDKFILQPSQIVLGNNDEFFNYETLEKNVLDHFTDLDLVILPGMNHTLVDQHPKIVSDINLAFLNN